MAEAQWVLETLRRNLAELDMLAEVIAAADWQALELKLGELSVSDGKIQAERKLIEELRRSDPAFAVDFNNLISAIKESLAVAVKGINDWKEANLGRVGLSRQASDGLSGYAKILPNLSYYIDRRE